MKTVCYVQEVDQHASNANQPVLINILKMIILIVSVVVRFTLILTPTIQIQQITNAFYVI